MIIHSVSDVHIKEDEDEAAKLFARFLERSQSADIIVLLGDIFDLVVGGDQAWIERFPKTFSLISNLSKNKKIYYVEGNHDFHMQRLFDLPVLQNVTHIAGDLIINQGNTKLRFSHGDDVEIDNPSYKKYKKIIKHRFIELLASEFVPVKYISAIGQKASNESAKKSRRYEVSPEHIEKIREKFRKSADAYYAQYLDFDLLICGHSHVKDLWLSPKGFTYANNGYFQSEKTYAIIKNGVVKFVDL